MLVSYKFLMQEVINLNNFSNSKNKIFFGEQAGIANYIDLKYPKFLDLMVKQLSFIWKHNEFSMNNDIANIGTLTPTQLFIFENNLAFQTLGDSFLGRSIDSILPYITNNEVRASFKVHSMFEECIHTPSYSHIIENIYKEKSKEKFEEFQKNPYIVERAEECTKSFNEMLNAQDTDLRKQVIGVLLSLYALESVSFHSSFVISFFFEKTYGKMTGTSKIIQSIARDEYLHRANVINVIKALLSNEEEGFGDLSSEIRQAARDMINYIAHSEIKWFDYLFSKGDLDGLSKNSMILYTKYLSNRAIVDLLGTGEKEIFEGSNINPFPWVSKYQGSSKDAFPSPQEGELIHYVKDFKNDLDDIEL